MSTHKHSEKRTQSAVKTTLFENNDSAAEKQAEKWKRQWIGKSD